ncbi:unnamed protein product [Plutella xylostella]|uniref:(diamondback moth) hypothetical protein n=1 Tax=Plutella xylostella TaxID=51655 RepID=A0A8S4G080_PLUXY|nr:unnamed protein product [Plutella xylostella]
MDESSAPKKKMKTLARIGTPLSRRVSAWNPDNATGVEVFFSSAQVGRQAGHVAVACAWRVARLRGVVSNTEVGGCRTSTLFVGQVERPSIPVRRQVPCPARPRNLARPPRPVRRQSKSQLRREACAALR